MNRDTPKHGAFRMPDNGNMSIGTRRAQLKKRNKTHESPRSVAAVVTPDSVKKVCELLDSHRGSEQGVLKAKHGSDQLVADVVNLATPDVSDRGQLFLDSKLRRRASPDGSDSDHSSVVPNLRRQSSVFFGAGSNEVSPIFGTRSSDGFYSSDSGDEVLSGLDSFQEAGGQRRTSQLKVQRRTSPRKAQREEYKRLETIYEEEVDEASYVREFKRYLKDLTLHKDDIEDFEFFKTIKQSSLVNIADAISFEFDNRNVLFFFKQVSDSMGFQDLRFDSLSNLYDSLNSKFGLKDKGREYLKQCETVFSSVIGVDLSQRSQVDVQNYAINTMHLKEISLFFSKKILEKYLPNKASEGSLSAVSEPSHEDKYAASIQRCYRNHVAKSRKLASSDSDFINKLSNIYNSGYMYIIAYNFVKNAIVKIDADYSDEAQSYKSSLANLYKELAFVFKRNVAVDLTEKLTMSKFDEAHVKDRVSKEGLGPERLSRDLYSDYLSAIKDDGFDLDQYKEANILNGFFTTVAMFLAENDTLNKPVLDNQGIRRSMFDSEANHRSFSDVVSFERYISLGIEFGI